MPAALERLVFEGPFGKLRLAPSQRGVDLGAQQLVHLVAGTREARELKSVRHAITSDDRITIVEAKTKVFENQLKDVVRRVAEAGRGHLILWRHRAVAMQAQELAGVEELKRTFKLWREASTCRREQK